MEDLLSYVLFFLYLPTALLNAESCGETSRLFGLFGGEVTLPVHEAVTTSISWVKGDDGEVFAITRPRIVIINNTQYNDQLKAAANGSLIIINLTESDEGTYRALKGEDDSKVCLRSYQLIIVNLQHAALCEGRIHLSGLEGGEVTLPGFHMDFRRNMWTFLNGHSVEDERSKYTPGFPKNEQFNKRLKVTPRGDLVITRLTRKDAGLYVMSSHDPDCLQLYDLKVDNYTTMNAIRLVFSILVLSLTCGILIHHLKTSRGD